MNDPAMLPADPPKLTKLGDATDNMAFRQPILKMLDNRQSTVILREFHREGECLDMCTAVIRLRSCTRLNKICNTRNVRNSMRIHRSQNRPNPQYSQPDADLLIWNEFNTRNCTYFCAKVHTTCLACCICRLLLVIGSASLFAGTRCTWKAVWKVSLVCGSFSSRVDRISQWTWVTT